MQLTRTDIHRPSVIVPGDYQYIAILPHDPPGTLFSNASFRVEEMNRVLKLMRETGGRWSGHEHGGSCEVCGNVNALTLLVYKHVPTNTFIRIGQDCADKLEMGYDFNKVAAFKRDFENWRSFQKGIRKAQGLLGERGLARAWAVYEAELVTESNPGSYYPRIVGIVEAGVRREHTREDDTIRDLVAKLVKYGELSEKQWNFLAALVSRIDSALDRKAQQAIENARSGHLGTVGQRLVFTATVQFTKFIEDEFSRFGGYTLTVLKDRQGNILKWNGTGFPNADKGTELTFKATVKAHSEYQGTKQTLINRCTLVESK